jgi:hypothetical protein
MAMARSPRVSSWFGVTTLAFLTAINVVVLASLCSELGVFGFVLFPGACAFETAIICEAYPRWAGRPTNRRRFILLAICIFGMAVLATSLVYLCLRTAMPAQS